MSSALRLSSLGVAYFFSRWIYTKTWISQNKIELFTKQLAIWLSIKYSLACISANSWITLTSEELWLSYRLKGFMCRIFVISGYVHRVSGVRYWFSRQSFFALCLWSSDIGSIYQVDIYNGIFSVTMDIVICASVGSTISLVRICPPAMCYILKCARRGCGTLIF